MIKYLLGIAILLGIYFFMIYKPKTENHFQEPFVSFISSNKFAGAKEGFVFKMDSQGLGYYLDKY
jgi:hypothetical protein